MRCPSCSHTETSVTDSRPTPDSIRRRRSCDKCGFRFTTYEIIAGAERDPSKLVDIQNKLATVANELAIYIDPNGGG